MPSNRCNRFPATTVTHHPESACSCLSRRATTMLHEGVVLTRPLLTDDAMPGRFT